MNKENKKKIIFIGILAFALIGGIFAIQAFNSDEETEPSEEFSTPESQRQAYNSKMEAYNTDKQAVNMGSFEDNFKSEKRQQENTSKSDESLFDAIDRQIASMGGGQEPEIEEKPREISRKETTPYKTTTKGGVSSKKSKVNEEPLQEETPKKSRRQLREERLQQEAQASGQFQQVDEIVQQQQPAKKPRRVTGKKLSFEDLPETEQRRILLQTGQRTYQESSEIMAKIISTGEVKAGQTIRLMLQEKAVLSFKVIPRGTTISGVVSFNDNRMKVNFSTIRLKNEIINVNLELYAMDGIHGLPISGESHTKETEDEGIDEAISRTGRIGRVIGSVAKSVRRSKEVAVNLGNDIACILVNNNIEE